MPRVGRNEPCPCGSGQKFKKCCGRAGLTTDPGFALHPPGTYYRFRVSLSGSTPPVWRSFLLRASASFHDLHDAIQACGWTESHLWHFTDPATLSVIAGIPDDHGFSGPDPDAKTVRLASRFTEAGDRCIYLYDFGDGWEHEVLLEGIEHRVEIFERALLGGAGSFPPEDCGGIPGFLRLREFLATGKDPWGDDEALREWTDGLVVEDFDVARDRRAFGAVLSETPSKPSAKTSTAESACPHASRVRSLDHAVVDEIVHHVDDTLEDVRARMGLVIRVRRASFTEGNAKIELEAATIRDDGIVMDKQAEDFLRSCGEFGLDPEDLGQSFRCDEDTLRVVGLRPRAKQPVICEQIDQHANPPTRVRMSAVSVREHLSRRGHSERKLRLVPPRSVHGEAE